MGTDTLSCKEDSHHPTTFGASSQQWFPQAITLMHPGAMGLDPKRKDTGTFYANSSDPCSVRNAFSPTSQSQWHPPGPPHLKLLPPRLQWDSASSPRSDCWPLHVTQCFSWDEPCHSPYAYSLKTHLVWTQHCETTFQSYSCLWS